MLWILYLPYSSTVLCFFLISNHSFLSLFYWSVCIEVQCTQQKTYTFQNLSRYGVQHLYLRQLEPKAFEFGWFLIKKLRIIYKYKYNICFDNENYDIKFEITKRVSIQRLQSMWFHDILSKIRARSFNIV